MQTSLAGEPDPKADKSQYALQYLIVSYLSIRNKI